MVRSSGRVSEPIGAVVVAVVGAVEVAVVGAGIEVEVDPVEAGAVDADEEGVVVVDDEARVEAVVVDASWVEDDEDDEDAVDESPPSAGDSADADPSALAGATVTTTVPAVAGGWVDGGRVVATAATATSGALDASSEFVGFPQAPAKTPIARVRAAAALAVISP